jgi:hypothetical protein
MIAAAQRAAVSINFITDFPGSTKTNLASRTIDERGQNSAGLIKYADAPYQSQYSISADTSEDST